MSRRKKRRGRTSGGAGSVAAVICLTLFIFTAAVTCILHSRWLYYLDIRLLDIPSYSGMNESVIRTNYQALISYCSLWNRGELVLPTLAMSRTGRIHFQECKRIFDIIQLLFIVSGLGTLWISIRHRKTGNKGYLRAAGITSILIPVVLGVFAFIDFNRFFTLFHSVMFRNDYWLFDPATDPVILILPETYFLHCAAGILLLILAGALICLRRSRR